MSDDRRVLTISDGKLAAMHESVAADSEAALLSSFDLPPERLLPESSVLMTLRTHVAARLHAQAGHIAARWGERSKVVALREPCNGGCPDETGTATTLVKSLAAALASNGTTSDGLVALGFTTGVNAFECGRSLHHTLKGLDLLSAMVLYTVEMSVENEADATMADGVRISRRLQQTSSLLTLAVTKGYTQAMSDTMRKRFHRLRHDLRNPLGTIKGVLAMMDDETMPAETRTDPRFRAMAKRNIRLLSELITGRLSDAEAVVPVLVRQAASLRTIACGVRRGLRREVEARTVTIVVGSARPRATIDAIGLELLLHELLLAALKETVAGDELNLEFDEMREDRAMVTLLCTPTRRPISDAGELKRLAMLAAPMRAEFEVGRQAIMLLIPVWHVEAAVYLPEAVSAAVTVGVAEAVPVADRPSSGREHGYDVRSANERKHG